MTKDKSDLRIGELLIEAQILRARELSEAITIAKLTSLPIGRILVMSSYVGEKEFRAGLEVQSMVRDAVLPLHSAIQALSLMHRKNLSLDQALIDVGFDLVRDTKTNRLGELLIAAGIITEEQLDLGLRTSEATSLPLGRVLISLNLISEETLTTALNAQVFIRERAVTREQGVRGMVAAYERRRGLEARLHQKGFFRGPLRPSMRLGELFVLAKIISQPDVMDSLESAMIDQQPLGQALVGKKLIDTETLDAGLTLQEMLTNRTLTDHQAVHCLVNICAGKTLSEALCELEVPQESFKSKVRYHELLRVAGLVEHSDIELSDIDGNAHPSSADALCVANTLRGNGFLDERTYFGTLRCYFLIASGFMTIEQAMITLNSFSHGKSSFDETLKDLNWVTQTRQELVNDPFGRSNADQV